MRLEKVHWLCVAAVMGKHSTRGWVQLDPQRIGVCSSIRSNDRDVGSSLNYS